VWSKKGYSGESTGVEELIDSALGIPAIVAGSGRGVFEEVGQAQSDLGRFIVFACNDVSVFVPRLDHMVSLHTPKLAMWAYLRRDPTSKGYGNKDFRVHDAGLYGVELWHQWKGLKPLMALSGLFAAQIAYLLGCDPIVLCGVPCDNTPTFWQLDGFDNPHYAKHSRMLLDECDRVPEFRRSLRSMSGLSQMWLGKL